MDTAAGPAACSGVDPLLDMYTRMLCAAPSAPVCSFPAASHAHRRPSTAAHAARAAVALCAQASAGARRFADSETRTASPRPTGPVARSSKLASTASPRARGPGCSAAGSMLSRPKT
ncbi:hypothetical protein DIPPA_17227 [Diplonema papillatum]|nr:hypothetical protein DIPPA_17227 [Diplonema papillatum]